MRQLAHARPAMSADHSVLHEPIAYDACDRKKQIGSSAGSDTDAVYRAGKRSQPLPAAFLRASHITARSGSTPNQSVHAATPW